jgi:hypothetical protein
MQQIKGASTQIHKNAIAMLIFIGSTTMGSTSAFCQKTETIEATAMGTGTQLGQNVEIRLIIEGSYVIYSQVLAACPDFTGKSI